MVSSNRSRPQTSKLYGCKFIKHKEIKGKIGLCSFKNVRAYTSLNDNSNNCYSVHNDIGN